MIAVAARHAGFEVIDGGIRMSIPEIVQSAVEEDASVLGLSGLSGAHRDIATRGLAELARHGVRDAIPVVVGGIVPDEDLAALEGLGVRAVFTPKDYDLMAVIDRVLDVIGAPAAEASTHAASA
jgi:(2R)-ethylmalonyl-CoA mutase